MILASRKKLLVPKKMFFTKGVGTHRAELRSFELALRDAGIEKCNLVKVSSILPPECKVTSKNEGLKEIVPGILTFVVMARCSSSEPHRLIAASIGCAVPADPNTYGYLSEHHAYGQSEKVAGDFAEEIAVNMLASTLGMEIDESKTWDERKKELRISDKIVRTSNVTQSAVVNPDGRHSTVVAVAIFIF